MLWDPILLAMAFSMLLLVLISVFQNARALAAREKRGSQPNDMEKGADESNTKELP
jgi:hypothetical protein